MAGQQGGFGLLILQDRANPTFLLPGMPLWAFSPVSLNDSLFSKAPVKSPLLHHALSGSSSLQSWAPAVLVCPSLLATTHGSEFWLGSGTEEMLNVHLR